MVRAEKVKPCEIRPGCGPGARRAVLVFIRRRHAKKTDRTYRPDRDQPSLYAAGNDRHGAVTKRDSGTAVLP